MAKAAAESGVALRPILDMDAYIQKLMQFVFRTGLLMKPVFDVARRAPERVPANEIRFVVIFRSYDKSSLTLSNITGKYSVARQTRSKNVLSQGIKTSTASPGRVDKTFKGSACRSSPDLCRSPGKDSSSCAKPRGFEAEVPA